MVEEGVAGGQKLPPPHPHPIRMLAWAEGRSLVTFNQCWSPLLVIPGPRPPTSLPQRRDDKPARDGTLKAWCRALPPCAWRPLITWWGVLSGEEMGWNWGTINKVQSQEAT